MLEIKNTEINLINGEGIGTRLSWVGKISKINKGGDRDY